MTRDTPSSTAATATSHPARGTLLTAAAVTALLGLLTKVATGADGGWLVSHAGGVLYEAFWIVAVLAVWPRLAPVRVAAGVLLVTCALEALQLWQPEPLMRARATFVGRALLGSTFDPWDFPHYALGCGLTLLWLRRVARGPVADP